MENLKIYNAVKTVPKEAQKSIGGGRLKGMTDINPMWRIKTLTEQFGVCGFGWKYEIVKKHLEDGRGGERAAFVDINLYVKMNSEWSEPIPGTGGSAFVAAEKNGLYTSDECFKMALTDAISVACKSLGFGAEVYWSKDNTKYDNQSDGGYAPPKVDKPQGTTDGELITKLQANRIYALSGANADICKTVLKTHGYAKSDEVKKKDYEEICKEVTALAADNSPDNLDNLPWGK